MRSVTAPKKVLGIFVLFVLLFSACGSPTSIKLSKPVLPDAKRASANGILKFSLTGEPTLINPILSTDVNSSAVEGLVYEGLVQVNKNLQFEPLLAEKWTVSADGLKWNFFLKKNVLWHDGKAFNADDVIFTFQKILDPKTNTVRRNGYLINGKAIAIKKINDFQIEITLPEPFAPFIDSMGMGILPKHLFANQNINTTALNRKPVGTGPFMFKEWKSGSYVRLIRNPKYHAGKVQAAEVIYKIYPETNTALVALESAEIHEEAIPPKDLPRFSRNKSLNLFLYEQLQYFYIGFNLDGLFKDKNLRLAFAQAIDKDKMIKVLFKGLYTPAYSPMPKVSWAYEPGVKKYEFNPGQSKKLIEASGYKFNKQTGYYEKNGMTLQFEILLPQGRRDSQRACEMMQQFLKQVGIKMELRSLEWTALLKILNAPTSPKKFDVTMMGWSAGVDPDGYSIWHSSQYPQGFNFIHYQNKEVDELLIKGRRTLDQKKRAEIYSQIQKLIAEDQPYYFLWYPKTITAVSKKLGGYDPEPGPAGPFLKSETIFVTE